MSTLSRTLLLSEIFIGMTEKNVMQGKGILISSLGIWDGADDLGELNCFKVEATGNS